MFTKVSLKLRLTAAIAATALLIASVAFVLGACEKSSDGAGSTASGKTSAVSLTASAAKSTAAKTTVAKTTSAAASGVAAESSADSNSTASSEQTEPAEATLPESADEGQPGGTGNEDAEEKTYDLKGREILFKVYMSTMIPSETPGNIGGPKLYYLMKEAEQKFNCKFKFDLLTSEALVRSELTNAGMAGVYYSDVARFNGSGSLPLETNNLIMPINDYIDLDIPYIKQYDHLHWHGIRNPQNVYALFRSVFQGPTGVWYDNDVL